MALGALAFPTGSSCHCIEAFLKGGGCLCTAFAIASDMLYFLFVESGNEAHGCMIR
jgi:hypothetical protein